MRAAHDSDPEDDCSAVTSEVPYVLLGDEELVVQLCLLVVASIGIDKVAAGSVTSMALGSLEGGICGVSVKAEAVGAVEESEPEAMALVPVISGSKRSLSRLIVSST